jgi:hypothetical protein
VVLVVLEGHIHPQVPMVALVVEVVDSQLQVLAAQQHKAILVD